MAADPATVPTPCESVVVRFAGDSGDGMQLTGAQFALTTAWQHHNLRTLPDYPAEIRAPAGSTYGVSSYQINFGSDRVFAGGDRPDVLVAMNPAALKVHLPDVEPGGLVIVDTGSFKPRNLKRAGYAENPLQGRSLAGYQLLAVDISGMAVEAVREFDLTNAEAHRTKNMWSLGLMCWIYGHPRDRIVQWLEEKFAKRPVLARSNVAALDAGYAFGDIAEIDRAVPRYDVDRANFAPGVYRAITGGEALGIGLIAGARLADRQVVFASYPITPASPILHFMAAEKRFGVVTFQAEDEIAAVCAAIGASYAGSLGVTSSSGPGIALKTEALGLAITCELPLIVVNSQRGGPSTGLPTKTEQSDLLQAVHGRNGDAPLVVLAPATPADCFAIAIEAVRIATRYMTPVMILSDGLLANASEPWKLPRTSDLEPFPTVPAVDPAGDALFRRDPETLARPWAAPGTPGLEHRIGGLEKDMDTGAISYDGENHQRMTDLRKAKVAGVARDIPDQAFAAGPERGRLVVVSWGSPYGRVRQAVQRLDDEGFAVAHLHLRHLCPFPANLGDLLAGFEKALVVEMNTGQLRSLLRAEYRVDARGFNRVNGRPFQTTEIVAAIRSELEN